jgi:arylsulfatase
VIDVLPTTLEFIGIKQPGSINGIKQDAIQEFHWYIHLLMQQQHQNIRSNTIIFSDQGHLYKDGWKAGTLHHPDYIDERLKDSATLQKFRGILIMMFGNYTT